MELTDPNPPAADASLDAALDILVITAHPQMEHSRINRRLMRQAARLAEQTRHPSIIVRDLYALYPDYLIDTAQEQALLARARLVVWQHPIHWYSMPPLMKLWLDEVLTFGWAYGPGGSALRGKDLWVVATTGGPEDSYRPDSYNRYFFEAFLPPYEQTAALCGMRFLPPMVLHGAHRASEHDVAEHEQVYVERIRTYPDWPELDLVPDCIACEVPDDARPPEPAELDAPPAAASIMPPPGVAARAAERESA